MRYNPLKKDNKAVTLTVISAVFAVILFATSAFVNSFVLLYQASALVLAVVSLQIYLKYVASDYVYEATDTDLKIYRVNGKKSICVASLSYECSKSSVMTEKYFFENRKSLPKYSYTVNYAKNIAPKTYSLYLFDFNGKTVRMKFEPDDVFTAFVNSKIENSLAQNKAQEI